jgi:hypothetical protein
MILEMNTYHLKVAPSPRWKGATARPTSIGSYRISVRRACRVYPLDRSTNHYVDRGVAGRIQFYSSR